MGQEAKTAVIAADFPGQVSNMDPHDIPAGAAQRQVNLTVERKGQMTSRRGFRLVTFEN